MPENKPKGILAVVDDLIAEVRGEFVTHFKTVIQLVKDLKETNGREFNSMRQFLSKSSDEMKSEMSSGVSMSKQEMMNYCSKEMSKMMKEHEKKMYQMDEKMNAVQDGLAGKDADEKRVVEEVLSKVPTPPFLTSVEIRDRLEILKDDERLDKSAIKGLEDEIKTLRKEISTKSSGGGTSAMGVRQAFKYIAHTEAPVGNIDGVNTTYTVKNAIWWIAGFTLNGEQVAQLPNFTYAGNTITFTTPIPAVYSGKDFEIKYIG